MEKIVNIERVEDLVGLFGEFDCNMKAVENAFHVNIVSRDGSLKICGNEEENLFYAQKAVETLLYFIVRGEEITTQRLDYCIAMAREGSTDQLKQLSTDCICITVTGKPIKPKTLGQKNYIEQISKNTVVFGITGGYRQDLSGGGDGGESVQSAGSQSHHPDSSGCRGMKSWDFCRVICRPRWIRI